MVYCGWIDLFFLVPLLFYMTCPNEQPNPHRSGACPSPRGPHAGRADSTMTRRSTLAPFEGVSGAESPCRQKREYVVFIGSVGAAKFFLHFTQ